MQENRRFKDLDQEVTMLKYGNWMVNQSHEDKLDAWACLDVRKESAIKTFAEPYHKDAKTMHNQSFVQAATQNLTNTSKSVVSDAIDVATGMAAVEVIKQLAFSVMPVKVGFIGRLMGANSWVKNNAFVALGIVTVVHTVLKSSQGRLSVNDNVMQVADNALRYATFKAVEAMPINKLIQDLSEKLAKVSGQ